MPNIAQAAWLQSVMTHRIVTEKQSRALHQAACDAARVRVADLPYEDFVLEASTALSSLGLEIRRMINEWTGKPLLAIVNTKGDEIAQLATSYTANELALLKNLIDAIFTAPDDTYCVSTMSALKEAANLKPALTKKAAEETLENLINHRWLHRSESGRLSLSSRTLLELQSWLKEQYPEYAIECSSCRDLVTRGSGCSATANCPGRVHHACEKRLPGIRQHTAKCPECKQPWEPAPIGEESEGSGRRPNARREASETAVVSEDEDALVQDRRASSSRRASTRQESSDGGGASSSKRRRTSKQSSRNRVRSTSEDVEEEEEEREATYADEEDDEELGPTQPTPAARRTARRSTTIDAAPARRSSNANARQGRPKTKAKAKASTNGRRSGGGRGFVDDEAEGDEDEEEDEDVLEEMEDEESPEGSEAEEGSEEEE